MRLLILLLSILSLPSSFVEAQQVPKINFDTDAPRNAAYQEQLLRCRMTEIDFYDQCTKDPKAARPATKRFLAAAARSKLALPTRIQEFAGPSLPILVSLSDEAIRLGSTDPLFQRYLASITSASKPSLRNDIQKIIKSFQSSSYPEHFLFEYLDVQACKFREGIDLTKNKKAVYKEVQILEKHLVSFSKSLPDYFPWLTKQPDFQRNCLRQFKRLSSFDYVGLDIVSSERIQNLRLELSAKFVEAYSNTEDHDPWLLSMMQGEVHHALAWQARGTGYASTISKERYKTFKEEQEIAVGHYKEAYRLNPKLPEAASAMIRECGTGYDDNVTIWTWFERCTNAELDHFSAFTRIQNALNPKWGGSEIAQSDFANQCARSKLYSTKVPIFYLKWVFKDGYGLTLEKRMRSDPSIYSTLKEVVQGLLDDPVWNSDAAKIDLVNDQAASSDDQNNMNDYENELRLYRLIAAIRSDEYEDATELFSELDNAMDTQSAQYLFQQAYLDPIYEKSRCSAFSEFYDELISIQPLLGERSIGIPICEEINRVYADLATRCLPESKRYLETWRQITELEIKFHQGQWVDIPFDKDVNTFNKIGNWTFVDKNTLVGDSLSDKRLLHLYSKCVFPEPMEMTMDVSSTTPNKMEFGFAIGTHGRGTAFWPYYATRLRDGRGASGLPQRNGKFCGFLNMSKPTSLSLTCWGPEHTEFRVNNALYPEAERPGSVENADVVGFTNLCSMPQRGKVTVKNLRVRKPLMDPPPSEKNLQETVDYYTKAMAQNNDRPDYYYFRGLAFYRQKQYGKAHADLETAANRILPPPHWARAKYYNGLGYLIEGNLKRGDQELIELFKFSKPRGYQAVTMAGSAGMATLIRQYLSFKEPTPKQITRANYLSKIFCKKFDNYDSYALKSSAQMKARNFDGAAKSIAKAKSKAKTAKQNDEVAELEVELKQKQSAAKKQSPQKAVVE